jgi:ATP-dependent RNA circularization protein (DNA/RNA ligase family)
MDSFEFGVCSRNLQLKKDNSNWWNAAIKYNVEEVLKNLFVQFSCNDFIAIQGEIVGVGIQENKYKFNEQKLFVFNFIVDGRKIAIPNVERTLSRNGLETVEILHEGSSLRMDLDELVEYSNRDSVLYPTPREGIVVRDYDDKVSFKVISPKFLLKHDL